MGHLYHSGIFKKGLSQILHYRLRLRHIPPSLMPERHIDSAAFRYGKAHAGNIRLMCVQRRPLLGAVCLLGRGFKVVGHHSGPGQIFFYFV